MKMAELKLPFIGHGGDYNPDPFAPSHIVRCLL